MPLIIRCPHCTKAMQVPDNSTGKQVKCPGCSRAFIIGPATPSAAAPVREPVAAGAEGAPNLCVNPACGVANPPGERTCQRCGNPLPTSPGTIINHRYRIDRL